MENSRELSYGEKAVGISFNPSQNEKVAAIKQQAARLIDLLDELRESAEPEVKRMVEIAITDAQSAQMWGVKAATWEA